MAIIQSNFGKPGNYEMVVKEGRKLVHYWRANYDRLKDVSYWTPEEARDDYSVCPWYKSQEFGAHVGSRPSLLQSNFGRCGNFELLVTEKGRLRHYWRDNDCSGLPWKQGDRRFLFEEEKSRLILRHLG
jgi:hypothetical protein